MIRNYLKIAYRNLKRQKSYAVINIVGLAAGLAGCLLILLLLLGQWRMDRFHATADRVHRVVFYPGPDYGMQASNGFATTPAPLAPVMRRTYSGIEAVVRIRETNKSFLKGEAAQVANRGLYVESSFFRIFEGFDLTAGHPKNALKEPFSVVLTQEAARRLFGEKNPAGRTVRLADTG